MRTIIIILTLAGTSLLPAAGAAEPPAPAKGTPLDASFLRLYAETRGFMLGRPVKARPTPDGKAVLFLRGEAKVAKLKLFEFDVATGKTRELLSPESLLKGADEDLSPEEKARRERMRVSTGGFADYQLTDDGRLVLVSLSGKLYTFDRTANKVRELKSSAGTLLDPKFSPDGSKVAYVRDNDVYAYDLATDKETRVTTGGTEEKTHGLAEFVAQEEMGRHSGYWWSPDSRFIAFEEADHAGVEVWYVADPASPGQEPGKQYYPRPGKQNVKVRLGVVPASGGGPVWVGWDRKKYEYLANVRWDKHGPLSVVLQDRLQRQENLFTVDPTTGKMTLILPAKGVFARWTNLHPKLPRWLPGGESYLWGLEARDLPESGAYPSLVLLRRDSSILDELVPRRFGFRELVAFNAEHNVVAFTGGPDPTQSHVYRRPLKATNGRIDRDKPEALTREPGLHTAAFAEDCSAYVLTSTTLAALPRSTVLTAGGGRAGELPSVALDPPFTPNVTIQKLGDGEGYYTAIVRPRDFDPKKKYPVLVDVYGGPKHLNVVQAMREWLLPQWLADQGFVVVAVDNRGTPGRGYHWEQAVYQKFGSVPLDDQVAGLKALGAKFPEMDMDRVGVYGWSFGGYMSALAVLRRPDVFKAAVAGAPVTDWEDYDTHYTERYMGLPKDNPDAYKEASLLTYADKLSRPLLLVHGTADDNVYFRHSLRLADALFRAGKEFEILPLPGLTHMVPDPVVTERLWTRIAGHFQKHLGGPK